MYCEICGKPRVRKPVCRECAKNDLDHDAWRHYCCRCGSYITRHDRECERCRRAHLAQVTALADEIMG